MLTYNYMKIRFAIIGKNVGTGTGNFPMRIRIPWKARFGFRHSLVWKVEFESAYDECDEISLVIDTVHTIQFAYKRFYFFYCHTNFVERLREFEAIFESALTRAKGKFWWKKS
jgi:hypothetical protein